MMLTDRTGEQHIRIVYIGMLGEFSCAPLVALLDAGFDVRAVIVSAPPSLHKSRPAPIKTVLPPRTHSEIPLATPFVTRNIVQIGWERGIDVYQVSRPRDSETIAAFSAFEADVVCVACFPYRIPESLLALPKFGFLNLHPSLLPKHRGPHPMFWVMRNGETSTGVTIHFMDEGMDTGDIAMQAPLDLPDGISGTAADLLAAELGAKLMVETVHALHRGTLARRKQLERGSNDPAPSGEDFMIDTTWSARRAFNFMRGTVEWAKPYSVEVNGERLTLLSADSYGADDTLQGSHLRSGNKIQIQFTPGVLRARVG